jgi:amino acid adenylation domain-containing protein
MEYANKNVVDLIEEVARLHPDRIAVISQDGETTYGELLGRMKSIAAWLLAHGAGPEVAVAVCAERSANWVAAVLGVLYSGAVYVPISPMSTSERKSRILAASGLQVLLTEVNEQISCPSITVVALDRTSPSRPPVSKRPEILPGQAAYAMHTSGSTGLPKCLLITHESLWHYVTIMRRELGIGPRDRYLHMASIEFSASIRQLLTPLVCGATVVVTSKDEIRDPGALSARIANSAVSVVDTVPSYLKHWIASVSELPRSSREGVAASLRLVLSTGESLSGGVADSLASVFPGVRLVNLYGQTETTGTVSFYPATGTRKNPVPIGQAALGTKFYVLNTQLEFADEGELFISGSCLGRGYQSDPGMTALRFLPDPFSGNSGDRMYRTGDLVCRLADGSLQFKGRTDNQIKHNGIRVDLGEIEARLLEHPHVVEAAVAVRETDTEHSVLAAFVVLQPGHDGNTADELRAFVGASLGESVTPALIVPLSAFPRTQSGKVDRPSLKKIDVSPAKPSLPSSRPTGTMQALVAHCWEEVLSMRGISVDDDFFALGGDSIQAIEMIVQLQRLLQRPIPLGALFFQDPTLGVFAQSIERASKGTLEGEDAALALQGSFSATN